MGAARRTIQQIAREHGLELQAVMDAAKRLPGMKPPRKAGDKNCLLQPHEVITVLKALGVTIPGREGRPPAPPSRPMPTPMQCPPRPESLILSPDDLPAESAPPPPDLPFPLRIHEDVLAAVANRPAIARRLGLVLQHLACTGRTGVVKGCKDAGNTGWLRTPLGGHGGCQFYLWWCRQGGAPVDPLPLAPREIVLRAIRHHDDHDPLSCGTPARYLPVSKPTFETDFPETTPWTAEQIDFIHAADAVRILVGRPGTGKTTSLWKAVESRRDRRVLYLTWSRELAESARERFTSFAPADCRVRCLDFLTFLGRLAGEDANRPAIRRGLARFKATLHVDPRTLGPWENRVDTLYAELVAYLVGRAVPGDPDTLVCGGVPRLSDRAYRALRGGAAAIGPQAAKCALDAFRRTEAEGRLAECFAQAAFAHRALETLRSAVLPPEFEELDRIVVDEVQDLTLLEFSVLLELCRCVAERRTVAPRLLVAGDVGQTVLPSGFSWGPYKELLGRKIATPREFFLDDNLRCPERIARIVKRAGELYATLEKYHRPTKQHAGAAGRHAEARIFHVVCADAVEAAPLLSLLLKLEGAELLVPGERPPDWLDATLRDIVLTPDQAKGREFQTVCLLDPGAALARLSPPAGGEESDDRLGEILRRTEIDRMRVALSRATETLIFLDIAPSDAARNASALLLGPERIPMHAEELAELLSTDHEVSAEQRVVNLTRDLAALHEHSPQKAWHRARQAVGFLGRPDLPNGVADAEVRRAALLSARDLACRLVVEGIPDGVDPAEVRALASACLDDLHDAAGKAAFLLLADWCAERAAPPFELLAALEADGERWMRPHLAPLGRALEVRLRAAAAHPAEAARFAEASPAWLAICGHDPADAERLLRDLRGEAFDTLLSAGNLDAADLLLPHLSPDDDLRAGRLREAQGNWPEAAAHYERAGDRPAACRVWRMAGAWDRALPLAEPHSPEHDLLAWLNESAVRLNRLAVAKGSCLTSAEARRLRDLLSPLLPR